VKDAARAREIANKLDQLNGDRQEEERRILQSITTHFEAQPALREAFCIVIDGEGWHRGVIGITATRVVERYDVPRCDFARWRGGARLGPFHPRVSPAECARVLRPDCSRALVATRMPSASRYHRKCARIAARLDDYARASLTLADFEPALNFDAELALDQVSPEFFNLLQRLEPFGVGNPSPFLQPFYSPHGLSAHHERQAREAQARACHRIAVARPQPRRARHPDHTSL